MGITSAGIGSNLDIESIIASLMNVERKPLNNVTAQKTNFQTKLSAFGTLKSALASFQTNMSQLAKPASLNIQTASSGNTDLFKATANGNASNAQYNVRVFNLAQANKLASQGLATVNEAIGTGVMTIDFGMYDTSNNSFTLNSIAPALNITIDSSNNTLAGLRDAINAANGSVTASIINDGQVNGNRLVLTAKNSGQTHTMRINVADNDGLNQDVMGLSRFAHDPQAAVSNGQNLTVLQVAQNALISVDNISISKPSNSISDAIAGVTLNLLKESTTSSTLSIAQDNTAITTLMENFVKSYNDLNNTVRNLTKVDESGRSNGALLGDSATRNIMTQIKQTLTGVSGNGELNTLSQVGIAFQRDGTLSLDKVKLNNVLETKPSQVSQLLSAQGRTSDALVRFSGNSSATKPGTYDVNVASLATQTKLMGNVAPNLTITAGVNDNLSFIIEGVSYEVTFNAGTYANPEDLTAALRSALATVGAPVSVALNAGSLEWTSNNYGAGIGMSLTSGNALNDLFGTPSVTLGLAAQGMINGVAATGLGRLLIGATNNDASGLIVEILGGGIGARGQTTFTTGFASQLDRMLGQFLNTDGLIEARTTGMSSSITRLTNQQETMALRLNLVEKRLRLQFTSLDTMIGRMTSTSSFLQQQLAQLNANN